MRGVGVADFLLGLVAVYGALGVAVALGFAVAGAARVVPGARVSVGARVLLMPAAAALWPLVLRRWCRGGLR
jgi:hypothetical protein